MNTAANFAYAVGCLVLLSMAICVDLLSPGWSSAVVVPMWGLWTVTWTVFMSPRLMEEPE